MNIGIFAIGPTQTLATSALMSAARGRADSLCSGVAFPFVTEAVWKLKKSKRDENDILGFDLKIEWACGVSAESGL